MIYERMAKLFCSDDISNIENYIEALNDKDNVWDCHHKLEIHSDYNNSRNDLKLMNLYYHRPSGELIFIKHNEHTKLHHTGMKLNFTNEHKEAISKAIKGKVHSEFGKLFKETYGISKSDDPKLYQRERQYYRKHHKLNGTYPFNTRLK